jgi:hypothetical protein
MSKQIIQKIYNHFQKPDSTHKMNLINRDDKYNFINKIASTMKSLTEINKVEISNKKYTIEMYIREIIKQVSDKNLTNN